MKIVECVQVNSKLKVTVVGEKGYVKFSKNLRELGKKFAVTSLEWNGNNWVVKGDIFELVAVSEKTLEYVEFTEKCENEHETWSVFVPTSDPLLSDLKSLVDLYIKLDRIENSEEQFTYQNVSAATVKTLMSRPSKTGCYQDEYQICERILPPKEVVNGIRKFSDFKNKSDIQDYMYKLGCFEIRTKTKAVS